MPRAMGAEPGHACARQGTWRVASNHQKRGRGGGLLPRPSEVAYTALPKLGDLRLLASRTVRELISTSRLVCGTLLGQPWETKTSMMPGSSLRSGQSWITPLPGCPFPEGSRALGTRLLRRGFQSGPETMTDSCCLQRFPHPFSQPLLPERGSAHAAQRERVAHLRQ